MIFLYFSRLKFKILKFLRNSKVWKRVSLPILRNKRAFFFGFLLTGGILLCFGFFYSRLSHKNQPQLSSAVSSPPDLRRPANFPFPISPMPNILPAGTQMMIPPWLLQQYHLNPQAGLYGDPLNFLIHHYGLVAPSLNNKEEDTYYIPLTRYKYGDDDDDDDDGGYSKTVMMDVVNLEATAKPADTSDGETTTPGEFVLTTKRNTEITDPDRPAVPKEKPVGDVSPPHDYQATCSDTEEATTEAAFCEECKQNDLQHSDLQKFANLIKNQVESFEKSKNFAAVKNSFCSNCYGVDLKDFAQYAEQRSKSENVPPEILFAIMLRESNGKCDAKPRNGEQSFGLFQLNMANSTKLRTCKTNEFSGMKAQDIQNACKNGNYRDDTKYNSHKYETCIKKDNAKICTQYNPPLNQRPNIGQGICLNNPYCNFEEALHLLKGEKWRIGNGQATDKPTVTEWTQMSREDRNKWRNAVIAYNGAGFLKKAECNMKQSIGANVPLGDWEVKRLFFVRQYMGLKTNGNCNPGSTTQARQNLLIHNLAYMERITGRETPGKFGNSSICQWIKFRKDNQPLSCNQ